MKKSRFLVLFSFNKRKKRKKEIKIDSVNFCTLILEQQRVHMMVLGREDIVMFRWHGYYNIWNAHNI